MARTHLEAVAASGIVWAVACFANDETLFPAAVPEPGSRSGMARVLREMKEQFAGLTARWSDPVVWGMAVGYLWSSRSAITRATCCIERSGKVIARRGLPRLRPSKLTVKSPCADCCAPIVLVGREPQECARSSATETDRKGDHHERRRPRAASAQRQGLSPLVGFLLRSCRQTRTGVLRVAGVPGCGARWG